MPLHRKKEGLAKHLFCVKIMTTIKEFPLGHGAMVAHQTLDLIILVRIQVPQPETELYYKKMREVAAY